MNCDGFMKNKKKNYHNVLDIAAIFIYYIIVVFFNDLSAPTAMRLLSHCSFGTHIIMQATVNKIKSIL